MIEWARDMTVKHLIKWMGLALLLLPVAATAVLADQEPVQLSPPVNVPTLLEFGSSLLLVIAAIFLVGWFYARVQGMRGGSSKVINILASQSLGSKERIVLVEVGDKQIVVGMTSTSLQTLHIFDEPVVVADERANSSAFAERLATAFKGAAK